MNVYMLLLFILCMWRAFLFLTSTLKYKKALYQVKKRYFTSIYNKYMQNSALMYLWIICGIAEMTVCRIIGSTPSIAIPDTLVTLFLVILMTNSSHLGNKNDLPHLAKIEKK